MARRPLFIPGQHDLFPPVSDWSPPAHLPFVHDGAMVAVDCETRDLGLQNGIGPGWVSRNGHLCGVSWAFRTGEAGEVDAGYAPVRHPDTVCFSEEQVVSWLLDVSKRCEIVFMNASYDMGWTGVRPTMPHDVHTMAVLLDENQRSYTLDAICERLGIPGKDETLLREAVATHGGNPKRIKEHIWQLPARYVGPYAEQDAVATLLAAERMQPLMVGQGLIEAYDLERELAPHILEMRRRGIRIDIDAAERNQHRIRQHEHEELVRLGALLDQRRLPTIEDCRSPRWLAQTFTDLGVLFPRTERGQPSFEKEWLEACPHPAAQHIAQARALHDGAEKFIGNYILDHLDRGRLHAEIHQLRSDDGGTRTFRFSYSNPPLQQMNRADPDKATPGHKDYRPGFVDLGTMVRECFIPEDGCVWSAPDYSQQEYRMIVHYSARMGLRRVDEAVEYYRSDPDADFHNLVMKMTGDRLTRKRAKDCNFAKSFGAGIPKFALMTGMSEEEAAAVMRLYDEQMPFVSQLSERCKNAADKKGYVRLMDGRRRHFDEWEASWIPREEWVRGRAEGHLMTPCSPEEARRRQETPGHPWRGKTLRRADTRKAGNSVIQGSSAVQTKKALLACAREGLLPLLQMHDELCFSVDNERDCERSAEIMRDVVQLIVPAKVDLESGPNWGKAKYDFRTAMRMVEEARR